MHEREHRERGTTNDNSRQEIDGDITWLQRTSTRPQSTVNMYHKHNQPENFFFITTENVHTHHKSPIKVKPHKRKAYTGTVVMSQKAMYMMMSPEGNEETSG